jgi:hypothetical protein
MISQHMAAPSMDASATIRSTFMRGGSPLDPGAQAHPSSGVSPACSSSDSAFECSGNHRSSAQAAKAAIFMASDMAVPFASPCLESERDWQAHPQVWQREPRRKSCARARPRASPVGCISAGEKIVRVLCEECVDQCRLSSRPCCHTSAYIWVCAFLTCALSGRN